MNPYSQSTSSTDSEPEINFTDYPEGFRFGAGSDIIVDAFILRDYIAQKVAEAEQRGRIDEHRWINSHLPYDDERLWKLRQKKRLAELKGKE